MSILDNIRLTDLFLCVFIIQFIRWLSSFLSVLHQTRGQPGFITLFRPYHFVASIFLPHHYRISVQRSTHWKEKDELFRKFGSSVLVVVCVWKPCVVTLVCDPEAIDMIASDRQTFGKTGKEQTKAAGHWGENILISPDGPSHRKHRKIAAPAFSEANNAEVWKAALSVSREWFAEIDKSAEKCGGVAVVDKVEDYLQLATLIVIGKAGFGVDFSWDQHTKASVGNSLSFFDATKVVLRDFVPDALLPKWAFSLPSPYLQKVKNGFDKFDETIRGLLQSRKEQPSSEDGTFLRNDILGLLVASNEKLKGKDALTEKEMLSDIFTFLFAGHDTTSNSLAGLLTLLALHPEHQAKLFTEVSSVLSEVVEGEDPPYETFNRLPYTLACVREGLRLGGPVPAVVKSVMSNAMLPARTLSKEKGVQGEKFMVPVAEGSAVQSCFHAVHYTEEFWPDAVTFSPSRWLTAEGESSTDRQAWYPFSNGTRSCIGQKFALIEAVTILSQIVLRYKFELPAARQKEYALRPGETERERRDRAMNPNLLVFFAPRDVQLAFSRREKKG